MNNTNKLVLTAAIAGIIGAGTLAATPAHAAAAKGECSGINKCKGKGACKSASNECKGQNGCKGKGWMAMTEKACTKKKGTWSAMADAKDAPKAE